jgi:hypothetical protein
MNGARASIAAPMVIVGGLSFSVIAGVALTRAVGGCHDVGTPALIFARTSIGTTLPVPVVQQCTNALPLFLSYYAGYLTAFAGMIALTRTAVTRRALAALTCAAVLCALALPFAPNTDPYAYAMYAYEAAVLHNSPYVVNDLAGAGAMAHSFAYLFPRDGNPIRADQYGPVFTAVYALAVGPFGHVSLGAMIVAERILGAALLLLLGFLVSTSARPGEKRSAFVLVALNPLLLFESISFAHGDVAMLALLAGAYLAFKNNRLAGCAALCVLAAEVRVVAIVSLAVLMAELLRRCRYRDAIVALTTAAISFAISDALSHAVFGTFRLSGAIFHSTLDSPLSIISAGVLADRPIAILAGLVGELMLGGAILYAALRERAYRFVAVAALVSLPVLEAWYVQWVVPVAAVTRSSQYRWGALALVAVAPLKTMTDMLQFHYPAPVHIGVVAIFWIAPIAAYAAACAAARSAVVNPLVARSLPGN